MVTAVLACVAILGQQGRAEGKGLRVKGNETASQILYPLPSTLYPSIGLTVSALRTDITPPELLPLGGYTARHDEIMKPGGEKLYARCLLFESGGKRLALVSAEMLTIPDSLYQAVKSKIPSDIVLFLCATHTHSAPDSQMLNDRMTFKIPGIATFKQRWLDWYSDRIAECIKADADSGKNVYTQIGQFHVRELRLLRSNVVLNRGRRSGAKPDTEGTMLEWRGWMGVRRERAVRLSHPGPLFLEYAAHPVFYGDERDETSGDWPGEVSRRIEARPNLYYNPAFEVLPGALGDVSPHAPGKTPAEMIKNFSDALLGSFRKAKTMRVWSRGDRIGSVQVPITLDPPRVHPQFEKEYKLPQPLAEMLVKKFAPSSASITSFRFGSLAIVGIPGEPTSHIGAQIKQAGLKMGFKSVLVISHTNGWIGYILDPADYAQGGYEATLSFNGPQEGEHVVDAAIEALKKLL